ncbi:hypothetical protein PCASD_01397 [Puccinia coronata f. sp. avenae]|uniref:Uncharacterized protein n=1 Tax=Puccinia coronata f. sp. avenae TaxID=200324 RepID=A0A2N5VKQ9_9BASI|nr:hypothetical protein PCASD_01397 [Puccinia coronata f. sp. avenae]
MSGQGNQELTNHWNNPQLAPNPFPFDQSSSNHSAFHMNHNYGDYPSNHNYVDPRSLPTPQRVEQIHQFTNFRTGEIIVQPNLQQQRQSNNQQQASQASLAIPPPNSQVLPSAHQQRRSNNQQQASQATPAILPPNSQVLPNTTSKKRAAPRVQAHERLANIQRLAAPVEVVDDLHDLSQESDVDAAGEDDSDENLNAQSELDFGPAHEDDTALPPPLFIGLPSTPPLHAAPLVHGDADEVDHSKLQSMFGLDPEEAEMGRMILKARFSREAALVYSALSRRPRGNATHNQTDDGDREHIPPAVLPTQASVDLSSFRFGSAFKNQLKNFIRQTLTDAQVQTYNMEHVPADSKVIELSLMRMTKRWLSNLTPVEKGEFLLPGYCQKNPNPQAVQIVDKCTRESIKSEKGILRGCLMKNVVTNSIYRQVEGPIPNVKQLYAHIKKHLPCTSPFSQKTIVDTQVLVRFAYLRMATIAYHQSGQNKRAAQWGVIDPQLLLLQQKSLDYFFVWSELIYDKDEFLFGQGKTMYNQLAPDALTMPTEEEIEQQMIVSQERRAVGGSEVQQPR